MKPEQAARTLAIIGAFLLILAALVRLLAAYILTIDTRFLPDAATIASERNPVMGLYTLSINRRQVSFARGVTVPTEDETRNLWLGNTYSLDLDSGSLQAGAPNRDMEVFAVRDHRLEIRDNRAQQLLFGRQMAVFAVSDDGSSLAFAEASDTGGNWTLYAMRGAQEPEELAQRSYFADLSWSADGQRLVYTAPVSAADEIFVYDFETGQEQQITSDGIGKREPVLSVDGRRVAYLAAVERPETNTVGRNTPTPLTLPPQRDAQGSLPARQREPGAVEIFVLDLAEEGRLPIRLTDNDLEEFDLAWTAAGKILFSVWREEWPMVAWLWSVDPESRAVQRVYPTTAIERLSCQPNLWGADEATVWVVVSNTGKQAQDVPVEISMDRAPLDVVTERSRSRVTREEIRLNPGETRELEYTIPIVDDQKIFLAATIETGVEFPVSAAFCEVEPRTLLLPRLRWFGATLGLVAFGYLLSIPWLRHQKKAWLWWVWLLFLAFLVVLVGIESAVIFGALG